MDYLITMDDGSEAIAHYGVIGMKWGVRHDPVRTGDRVKSQVAKDRAKALSYTKKGTEKGYNLNRQIQICEIR